MSKQIIIDDGLKTYELVNKDKKVLGEISFNPSDVNIAHRYKEVVEELEKMDINVKAGSDTEDAINANRQMDVIAYEKFDYLVNANVSKTLFAIMGPFSLMSSGLSFIEYIMEVIGNIITQETGVRVKKMNKHIQKHTSKYHG